MLAAEFDKVNGLAMTLDLIQSGARAVSPYSKVFKNSMKPKPIYDRNVSSV